MGEEEGGGDRPREPREREREGGGGGERERGYILMSLNKFPFEICAPMKMLHFVTFPTDNSHGYS